MTPNGASGLADAAESRATGAQEAPAVAVFALDAALAERLRDSLPRITLHAADTVPALADLLVARPCRALGVEVAALGAGASELLARLAGLFPDLPVVALGSADDAPVVAPLLASGEVHAFLARPIVASAARDAFESALRRNAELARNADLRRAAALRRSSTFLVQASRTDEPATDSTTEFPRGDFRARDGARSGRARPVASAVLALRRAAMQPMSERLRSLSGPRLRAVAAVASMSTLVLLATAGLWLARENSQPLPASRAPATSPAPQRQAAAEHASPRAEPSSTESRVLAAEHAVDTGELDTAEAHARDAAAALAPTDAALAARVAAVLDAVAAARRTAERAALAEARWARAAREWQRMRAEQAGTTERSSRTSEASTTRPEQTLGDAR